MGWLHAALVATILLFVPGLREQFEAPKAAVVGVCGAGAWAAALAGRARPALWGLLDVAVLAWLAVEVLATALSMDPRLSLLGEPFQRESLITSAALAGLYVAGRTSFTPSSARRARDLLLAAAAAACAYALLQAARLDPIPWTRTASYGPGEWVRPFGTLGHPNLLGVVSAAAAALALGPLVRGERRWLYGPVAALCAATTVLTFSRAAWLGGLAGPMVVAVLAWRMRSVAPVSARGVVLAVVALTLMAALFVAGGWGRVFSPRLSELTGPAEGSAASRVEIWRSALAAWQARPLLGQGPDTFELVFPRYQTPAYWRAEWAGLPFHAHSIYLQTLATRGVLGALVAAAWALAVLMRLRSMWVAGGEARHWVADGAGAACAIGIAGIFGAIGVSGALIVVFLSALAASAPEHSGARRVQGKGAAPGRMAAVLAVSVAAAGWFAIDLAASHLAAHARAARDAAPAEAAEAARTAWSLAPWDDTLARLMAETLWARATIAPEPRTLLGEAESAARRAVALAPLRSANHQLLGGILATRAALGETAAEARAESAYRRCFELAPMNALALIDYARHQAALGRGDRAAAALGRAVSLYPAQVERLLGAPR